MQNAPPASAPATPPVRPRFGQSAERRLFKTTSAVPWDQDRWPSFKASELKCRCAPGDGGCAGEYFHDVRFMDALQNLRDRLGAPVRVTSGRRCTFRNRKVGGATKSQHMVAIAADIPFDKHDPVTLARAAVAAGFTGIGFGATFLHVDMRPARVGFHYPNGKAAWTARFGFDPASRFTTTGKL